MTSLAVRFEDVPGIRDTDWIDLTRGLILLTGRNNVGKSRTLQRMAALTDAVRSATVSGGGTPTYRVKGEEWAVTVGFRGDGSLQRYEVTERGSTTVANFTVQNGGHRIEYGGQTIAIGPVTTRVHISAVPGQPRAADLQREVGRLVYIPPQRVVQVSGATTPILTPDPSGNDLAQVIYTHRNSDTPQWQELEVVMRRLLPEIETVLSIPTSQSQITLMIRDRFARRNVPLSDAGTGVAQLLYFVAFVLFSEPGRIMLVDEPHAYLHPGAERELVSFLHSHPEHSYVCATHSPVFISAARPEGCFLLTRDEGGTSITSAFASSLSRAAIFDELGIDPGEVALAERILFVEGDSDTQIYPVLLERIGYNVVHNNCRVIQLHGAGSARPLQDAIDELADALRIDFAVCLDGDQATKVTSRKARVLPVREIEGLFVLDPEAVWNVFDEDLRSQASVAQGGQRLTLSDAQDFLQGQAARDRAKPSDSLKGLGRKMGIVYKKGVHGPRIAARVSEDALRPFRDTFNDWLPPPVGRDSDPSG